MSLSTAEPIRIPTASGAPQATGEVDLRMNLPAGDVAPPNAPGNFDPDDPSTYNHSTSVTIFDSLGDSHIMTYYFIKDPVQANEWTMFTAVDGTPVDIPDPGGQFEPDGVTLQQVLLLVMFRAI